MEDYVAEMFVTVTESCGGGGSGVEGRCCRERERAANVGAAARSRVTECAGWT